MNLYKHFQKFSETEIIGVANDLSPHYFNLAKSYREQNPETKVGSPGRFQVSQNKFKLVLLDENTGSVHVHLV